MTRVVVTGASGRLGARVVRLLREQEHAPEVVGVDLLPSNPAGLSHCLDLATADLGDAFSGADTVFHLASVFGAGIEGPEIDAAVEVTVARRVLEASGAAGVSHLIVMSSATVYGPWPNNAVPLTEDAPLRPHPDLPLAVQKAEIERLVAEWSIANPDAITAVLRPATVVADGTGGWLARALHATSVLPANEETPIQYLHIDDLAAAVVSVWQSGLDGAVNVAPDGWLTPTERRALDPVPKVRLPEAVALGVADWRWRLRLAGEEKDYPAKDHRRAFYHLMNHNVPSTIHAGEGFGPESIHQALHRCGANRIGHGVRLEEDPDLMAYVADNRVPLEVCLSSNLQSCIVSDLAEHPFRYYLSEGLRVCLNTDNTLFARTSPVRELRLAVNTFDLTLLETENLLLNGFKSAFLPNQERAKLIVAALEEFAALRIRHGLDAAADPRKDFS